MSHRRHHRGSRHHSGHRGKGDVVGQRIRWIARQEAKEDDSSYKGTPSDSIVTEYDSTQKVEEKGVLKLVTGERNTAFLRNRYQSMLDNANLNVIKSIRYLEDENKDLKREYNKTQGLKKDISAHEQERENAYDALGNLLNKETDFEDKMHKGTLGMYKEVSKNQSSKSIAIKQRMNNSDNEMRFASMMKYLDKYPEYQTKSAFRRLLEKIEEKEREIRHAKGEYNECVAKYNSILSMFKIGIQKVKDKIKEYNKLLEEGQKRINDTRYSKGFIYKHLTSERKKQELNLDTIKHRMPEYEHTLEIIEGELSLYKGRQFVEIED